MPSSFPTDPFRPTGLTRLPHSGTLPLVFHAKTDKPYFQAWLRRTRKQFAVSGRLAQTALVLSMEEGDTVGNWSERLRRILDEAESPSIDLLTRIDSILSGQQQKLIEQEEIQTSFW